MDVGSSKLTCKQRAFVDALPGQAGFCSAKAARLSGYAQPDKQGPRMLASPGIRQTIDAELDIKAMSKMEVLARISIEARRQGSFSDILTIDENGARFDWKKAEENGAIDCFEMVGLGGGKIKLNNPLPALFFLAKAYGLDQPPPLPRSKDNTIHREMTATLIMKEVDDCLEKTLKEAERTDKRADERADDALRCGSRSLTNRLAWHLPGSGVWHLRPEESAVIRVSRERFRQTGFPAVPVRRRSARRSTAFRLRSPAQWGGSSALPDRALLWPPNADGSPGLHDIVGAHPA